MPPVGSSGTSKTGLRRILIGTDHDTHPPALVAEQVLWLRRDKPTTPTEVNQFVYLCHAYMLGIFDSALIDEPVEAWNTGPVIRSLYYRYQRFGTNPIPTLPRDRTSYFDTEQNIIINVVCDTAKDLDMSSSQVHGVITHKETPWALVTEMYGEGSVIPNSMIRDYTRRKQETVQ